MDDAVLDLVYERLDREPIEGGAEVLVLAACHGSEALEAQLAGMSAAPTRPAAATGTAEPPGAYLRSISVQGFRGIGPPARLDLAPGPGLTLVAGRNGSGKSSFAEAVEFALTGTSKRWEDRSAVWREGWRNLHAGSEAARIEVELCVEDESRPLTVGCGWEPGAELVACESRVTTAAGPSSVDELGWRVPLSTYRPFLSYDELGSLLSQEPSKLYDRLATILGLEGLVDLARTLRDARTARERLQKGARDSVKRLLPLLGAVDDERARAAAAAVKGRTWDLDMAELALEGTVEAGDPAGDLAVLRTLETLTGPDEVAVTVAFQALRRALAEAAAVADTDAGRALATAQLLGQAIDHHETCGDGACPVCGAGTLDDRWLEGALEQQARLLAESGAATAASETVRGAARAARALITPAPAPLRREVGVDCAAALAAWHEWSSAPDEPDRLADHLEGRAPALRRALAEVRAQAEHQRAEREDAWRPVASALRDWLPVARQAQAATPQIKLLQTAETWAATAVGATRDERFAPIAAQAEDNWQLLRLQSNVEIGSLTLAGTATTRKVVLDVRVDGTDASALGVMSQGELHALALCLFLPRATMPESPFRFVVIDDPVQAMDPARVDGLARLLSRTAATRQVVVFTHDERLPEAVRRLGIAATVIGVIRQPGSEVDVRIQLDPLERALEDARAVLLTDELDGRVAPRVVPGLCRLAVEAACSERVRRVRLERGDTHHAVEDELARATSVLARVALAVFDDAGRAGDVLRYFDNRSGGRYADALQALKRGAHQPVGCDLRDLVRDTALLAREIAARP